LRIAIITDVFYPYIAGGVEKRYYEICKRLAKNNEIHIYTQHWINTKKEEYYKKIFIHRLNKVSNLYTKSGRRKITSAIMFSIYLFFRMIKSKKFDIIECSLFPYFPCFVGKFFSIIKRSKFVILFHEVWGTYWYKYFSNDLFSLLGRIIEIIACRLTKNLIAYTPTIKNLINKNFKIPLKNIFLIPSGVDIELFNNNNNNNKKKNQIVFIGRLIPEKKPQIFINVLNSIKNFTGIIIGDGPLRSKLQKYINENEINNIKLLGIQNYSNVVHYLCESTIFILPSIREGQGIVFLESMAAKTPVIGVKKYDSGVKDIIKNNYNGFLIYEDAITDLIQKVKILLSNEKIYKKFQKNGYLFAMKFNWNKIAQLQYKYYLKLIYPKIKIKKFDYFWTEANEYSVYK